VDTALTHPTNVLEELSFEVGGGFEWADLGVNLDGCFFT
jgi:hypothetical protein